MTLFVDSANLRRYYKNTNLRILSNRLSLVSQCCLVAIVRSFSPVSTYPLFHHTSIVVSTLVISGMNYLLLHCIRTYHI